MDNRRFRLAPILSITIVVIACAPLLLWMRSSPLLELKGFEREVYNIEMSYQITVLLLAAIVIGIVHGLTGKDGLAYLNLTRRDGIIRPEPWIGVKPKETESWRNLGLNFAVVITLVTTVVIYFQVVHGGSVSLKLYPGAILILVFALMNAFSEESSFGFRLLRQIDVRNERILLGADDSFLAGCGYFQCLIHEIAVRSTRSCLSHA
jgi:uncharacterized protein